MGSDRSARSDRSEHSSVESPSVDPPSPDASTSRSTVAARGLAALEAFLFGIVVLVLAIRYDSEANEGLVLRVDDASTDDRPVDTPMPVRSEGGGE